ncbi:MAG: SGNH/GDSL hydrolase family protein [Candidatus Dadabacteria bacterium]
MKHIYTYLALGDSYTIGEGVLMYQSFPYQVVGLLRKKGFSFSAPEIIAKTGWTTDELNEAIKDYQFLQQYDFVTLLIGVNNQYRGREIAEYSLEFENLLKQAIAFAHNKPGRVIVLSIPDYSVTPSGRNNEPEKTGKEIDLFNAANKAVCIQYKVQYIDITKHSKKAYKDPSLIGSDLLHPSAKEYKNWSVKLVDLITKDIK